MIYGNYDHGYLRLPDETDRNDTDDRIDDLRMLEYEMMMKAEDCREEEKIIERHTNKIKPNGRINK